MVFFNKHKKLVDELEVYKSLHKTEKAQIENLEKEIRKLMDENSHLAGDSLKHGSPYGAKKMNDFKKAKG